MLETRSRIASCIELHAWQHTILLAVVIANCGGILKKSLNHWKYYMNLFKSIFAHDIKKRQRMPSEEELALWDVIRKDLQDHLYTGLAGRFQIAGHQQVGRWAREYVTGKIVLEIACGQGHHLRYGANRYANYVGLDIHAVYLQNLRKRFPDTSAIRADAFVLPFRDGSVDCVLSVYCFEHFRELPKCLREIRRVLKPGGKLLVGLPAEGGLLYELGRQLTSKRYMERKYGINYDVIVRWEHWNTFKEVVGMVRSQFDILESRFMPFPFFPSVHINLVGCLKTTPLERPTVG
jgi:SAM-dependent methyltransferase